MIHVETRRRASIACACIAAIVGLMCLLPPTALGATISGKVLNMSSDASPVAGLPITLRAVRDSGVVVLGESVSGRDGSFRFARIDVGSGDICVVETRFAGQPQSSGAVAIRGTETSTVLAVHDTTSSDEAVLIQKLHLIVSPDPGGLTVTTVAVVRNEGPIYIGDAAEGPGGRRIGVRFHLPGAASDFQVRQGMLGVHNATTPEGFASTFPFFPGADTLVYSYVLPWDGDAEFVQESHYNVHSLSVMSMGESVELDVEGAEAAPIPMGPGGPTLVNMERVGIPPGTPVRIAVSGISEGMETGAWLVILAAILMVVVIVYVVASRGRHNDTESADLAPPDIAEPADAAESDADARPAEADELAERIALLDEAFENEDIEESEYVEQRRELKKKLTSALRDEEL